MKPIPILLDTDIGDDIDDALALVVSLNSPEVDLVGVTTVFRDSGRRAVLAREVLRLLNRETVPIHAGCSQPLLFDWEKIPEGQQLGRQFDTLDPALTWDDNVHAVAFITDSVRASSARGEVLTLVAIGALTNIAMAFHLAPDIVPICRVVMMGGKWTGDQAEWNILCDPEAAAMVFRSGADISMIGLDVTTQCVLTRQEERAFSTSPQRHARFLGRLIGLWGHTVTLHDPLTVLTLFSNVVEFEPKCLNVSLHDEKTRACTIESCGKPNVSAAVRVNVERAKALFFERVLTARH